MRTQKKCYYKHFIDEISLIFHPKYIAS